MPEENKTATAEPQITWYPIFPSEVDKYKQERRCRVEEMVKTLIKDPEHSGPYKSFVDLAVLIVDYIDEVCETKPKSEDGFVSRFTEEIKPKCEHPSAIACGNDISGIWHVCSECGVKLKPTGWEAE